MGNTPYRSNLYGHEKKLTLLNEIQNSHITQLHSVASKKFSPDVIEKYRNSIVYALSTCTLYDEERA